MYILRKLQCFLTLDAFKPDVGDSNTILGHFKIPYEFFKISNSKLNLLLEPQALAMYVQVYLNKLECHGKVNLFQ